MSIKRKVVVLPKAPVLESLLEEEKEFCDFDDIFERRKIKYLNVESDKYLSNTIKITYHLAP